MRFAGFELKEDGSFEGKGPILQLLRDLIRDKCASDTMTKVTIEQRDDGIRIFSRRHSVTVSASFTVEEMKADDMKVAHWLVNMILQHYDGEFFVRCPLCGLYTVKGIGHEC